MESYKVPRMVLLRLLQRRIAPLPLQEAGTHIIQRQNVHYIIQRKPRRKRIALYVDPPNKLRFVAPLTTRTITIENFLRRNSDWVIDRIEKYQKHPAPCLPRIFKEGETVFYLGTPRTLRITHDPLSAQGCQLTTEHVSINLPKSLGLSPKELHQDIRLEILLWYKKEAKRILSERTIYWSRKLGVTYRSLKIVSPQRQWGSCSAKNDIRYNWRVILGPLEAIDYLVVHELCHITHKNHSARFWQMVASKIPDYKMRRALLRTMDVSFTL